jgi:hypothetical protein
VDDVVVAAEEVLPEEDLAALFTLVVPSAVVYRRPGVKFNE